MPYIKQEDLDNWFTYHPPKPGQQDKYVAIRHLRETVMIVNQAIACYG